MRLSTEFGRERMKAMDEHNREEPDGTPLASRPDEPHAEAARASFDRAVAEILAEDRLPSLPDDASDLDIFEIATAMTSER